MSVKGMQGMQGMSGPASMCNFEIKEGCWRQEHAELQNLCLAIVIFLNKHPDIATRVEISKDSMTSVLLDSEETSNNTDIRTRRREVRGMGYLKIFMDLHKDKEFLKIMILPYLSLLVAIIALALTFLPRPV